MSDSPTAASPLAVLGSSPFNAETRLGDVDGPITPAGRHYVRNHFAVPTHDGHLRIDGAVKRPLDISAADLAARASWSQVVTLECAGNGRGSLQPPAPGEQWGLGAVGTSEWSGVPLAELLAEAGLTDDAAELLFTGADEGLVGAVGRTMAFQRSLPIGDTGGAYLVTAMNGQPLTPNHGAPVRLLVPGRYGMASVKWLARITAVTEPFRGFFQVDRYVVDGRPLGPIAPRAVIASPADGASVTSDRTEVRGFAWSGAAPISRVEVSTDGGDSWGDAELGRVVGPAAWREWRFAWIPPHTGDFSLVAVATDEAGNRQPLEQVRNDLGYINNQARSVAVRVVAT